MQLISKNRIATGPVVANFDDAFITANGTYYYLRDHRAVRVTTDANANVLGQQGHFPYGEPWYLSNTTTKWTFDSYERDSETGNDHANARQYISRLGRFSSPDPLAGSIGDPQSLNRYIYALNDPIALIDPSGMVTCGDSNGDYADQIRRWRHSVADAGGGHIPLDNSSDSEQDADGNGGCQVLTDDTDGGIDLSVPPLPPSVLESQDPASLTQIPTSPTTFQVYVSAPFDDSDDLFKPMSDTSGTAIDGAGGGGGGTGGTSQTLINAGRNQARLLLSSQDCAAFLKQILTNAGLAPNLDSFLQNFDSTTIIPDPKSEVPSTIYTAHVDSIGQSNIVHVDNPGDSDLAPTLLHEEFHTINYGLTDAGLAQYATGSHISPGPGISPARANFMNSRAATAAFNEHCNPNPKGQ
jgi:RHS repeat-associated protein